MNPVIITIHIGAQGIEIASELWQYIGAEYNLDARGYVEGEINPKGDINIFFKQGSNTKYVPRAYFLDLDATTTNTIYGKNKSLFDPKNRITASTQDANNFAKGYLNEGVSISSQFQELLHDQYPNSAEIQGFILVHSFGDGAGSGLTVRIAEMLNQVYGGKMIFSFSIVPSPSMGAPVVLPYNYILSMHKLMNLINMTVLLDYQGVYDKIVANLGPEKATNELFLTFGGRVIGNTLATLHFKSDGLRKMHDFMMTLVPFPRSHFVVPSLSPLDLTHDQSFDNMKEENIVLDLLNEANMVAPITLSKGVYSGIVMIIRGEFNNLLAMKKINEVKETIHFNPALPVSISLASSSTPNDYKLLGVGISNHSQIRVIFEKQLIEFGLMFSHEAYLNWYLGEGMVKDDFKDAQADIQKLVDEYLMDEQ